MYYLELALAILAELIGTNLMKLSNGFTQLWFSLGTLLYIRILFFLSITVIKGDQVQRGLRNLGRCRNCPGRPGFLLLIP